MAATRKSPPPAEPEQGSEIALTDRKVQAAIRTLRSIEADEKRLTEQKKAAQLVVKQALAGHEYGTVRGVRVVRLQRTVVQSMSATLVKKQYPEIAQECTVMTERTTFKLLDES